MKKTFSTSLLALLCCITTLIFAQKDPLKCKSKTGLENLNSVRNSFNLQEDLQLMTQLTNALQKDELIDTMKSYKLEIKDGAFYINDSKQSKVVTNKFRKYFRADSSDNYTIYSDGAQSKSLSNHNAINYNDLPEDKSKAKLRNQEGDIYFDGVKYQKSLQLMIQLINRLDKEGFLDSKKPYTLNVKAGELYINGNKQPIEVSEKFRKYFQSNNYSLIND